MDNYYIIYTDEYFFCKPAFLIDHLREFPMPYTNTLVLIYLLLILTNLN